MSQLHEKKQRRVNILLDEVAYKRLRLEAVELDAPMNRIAKDVLQKHFNHVEQRNEKNHGVN